MSLLTSEQRCAYFQSTLWCAELLGDPEWEPIETDKRALKVSSADTFFSETLATERTIRTSVAIAKKRSDQAAVVDQIKAIYAIGDGVNGHDGICHGGFIAALFDELLGYFISVNRKALGERSLFTVYLNITYLEPTPAPAIILGTAKIVELEGRKLFVQGTLENGKGTSYAKAEVLFASPKSVKAAL